MRPAPIAHPSNVQRWRRLLFVHWRWPLEDLRPHVPSVFQIDTFEGQAYVGLVAFEVDELRAPVGPAGLQLHFLETNVRTYIRSADGTSGVYFFSLDAASRLAVIGARITVGLPYFWATGTERRAGTQVTYELVRHARGRPAVRLSYTPGELFGSARPGSLDAFLVERYALFVTRGPTVWSVAIHHRPYPLQTVELHTLDETLLAANGLHAARRPPDHVTYAEGVDVHISFPSLRAPGVPLVTTLAL